MKAKTSQRVRPTTQIGDQRFVSRREAPFIECGSPFLFISLVWTLYHQNAVVVAVGNGEVARFRMNGGAEQLKSSGQAEKCVFLAGVLSKIRMYL